jgi:cold shock CspA family protein
MPTGVVKHKKPDQTYGFIQPSGRGADDVFFHVKNCIRIPHEGDEVSYTEAEDDKRPGRTRAIDVTPIEREAA